MRKRHFGILACLLAWSGSPSPLCSQESRDGPNRAELEALWNRPTTDLEYFVAGLTETNNDMVKRVESLCGEAAPLGDDQRAALQTVAREMTETFVRAGRVELCLMASSNSNQETRSPAEARLYFTLVMRLVEREPLEEHPFYKKWREIATPEQWAATREFVEKQTGPQVEHARRELEDFRRLAAGRFTKEDLRQHRIDATGEKDPLKISKPQSFAWEDTWRYPVANFVRLYRLTPEQQAAARAILDDCVQRARALRQRDDPEVRRLWKQLLTAYLDPKASQVPLHEALRQYRRVSQEAVRPIYEEMQRRLEAILTTEQKRRAGPPPPPPEWMRLLEIALADDDEPPAASRPTTQPTTSPAPTPPAASQPADPPPAPPTTPPSLPPATRPADQPATARPTTDDGGGA